MESVSNLPQNHNDDMIIAVGENINYVQGIRAHSPLSVPPSPFSSSARYSNLFSFTHDLANESKEISKVIYNYILQ